MISLGPGRTLSVNGGSFALAASGAVNIAIGGPNAGTDHGRVAVTGAIALNGSLDLHLVNGFVPTSGLPFPIMTWGSKAGSFSALTGLDAGNGVSFLPQIGASSLTLLTVGQTWVRLLPDGTPPAPRDGHTAVLDTTNDRMIVFGGRTQGGASNDMWVLVNSSGQSGYPAWVQLAPPASCRPPGPTKPRFTIMRRTAWRSMAATMPL